MVLSNALNPIILILYYTKIKMQVKSAAKEWSSKQFTGKLLSCLSFVRKCFACSSKRYATITIQRYKISILLLRWRHVQFSWFWYFDLFHFSLFLKSVSEIFDGNVIKQTYISFFYYCLIYVDVLVDYFLSLPRMKTRKMCQKAVALENNSIYAKGKSIV